MSTEETRMVAMEESVSRLFTGIDLKTLVIALSLFTGLPSLAYKLYCVKTRLELSTEVRRKLDYAMGVPGLCLIGIPVLDLLNGAPVTLFLVGLLIVGIVLLIAAAREVFLDMVLSILSGY